jgi:prepilin-type N-terminal cleavage/methylation domain-containing protein
MRNKNGFTLIEVIIVVAMIGIMAAISIPSMHSWMSNYRLKAAARDAYSVLQKARALAVKTNTDTAVIFDTANSTYDLCDEWDSSSTSCAGSSQSFDFSSLPNGIGYGHGSATAQVPGGAFPGDDVSYASPVNVATFNSRGLGNSGYIYLDHDKNTTTYAVGSLSSGSIRMFKWLGGAWE